ncbi:hypothetical protein J3B02_004213, partial [Coemansia erecta]
MAPILLKIKGTKLFSPFNEIEDVGDLSTLWRVCTKVKDSLENGSRLENLSWRLWHLHQTLEARGKGKDYRKLSPATTKQLERTIRRPEGPRKTKPMQIKVRLGKATGERHDADSAQTQAAQQQHSHNKHLQQQQQQQQKQQQNDTRQKSSFSSNGIRSTGQAHLGSETTGAAKNAGASSTEKDHFVSANSATGSDAGSDTSAASISDPTSATAADATSVSTIATSLTNSASDHSTIATRTAAPVALGSTGSSDPTMVAEVAAASALASLAPTSSSRPPPDAHLQAHPQAQSQVQAQAQPTTSDPAAAEGVQASDFMSFGPSSFLSSGFDLDAPQIEITLDDIFSANSGDWSQFGFGALPAGASLGLPGSMGEYGASSAIWGG